MKKHIIILLLLFVAMPVLVHSVTEEGIAIVKLSMEPVPFNERRDPASDSPYNAFDGNIKSSALYSNFTMEFAKPVTIDHIGIINGNAIDKGLFNKSNRERDIIITLSAVTVKSEEKAPVKKAKKIKKADTKKRDDKKHSPEDTDIKNEDLKDKTSPDKTKKDKPAKEKTADKNEEKKEDKKEEKKEEIKKSDTPEKVVKDYQFEQSDEYQENEFRFMLTADEKIIEPEKKTVKETVSEKKLPAADEKKKTKDITPVNKKKEKNVKADSGNKKSVEKKTDSKKSEKKKPEKKKAVKAEPVKKNASDKKTAAKAAKKNIPDKKESKSAVSKKKKPEKDPVKSKVSGKNIIEITNLKKDKSKKEKSAKEAVKEKTEVSENSSELKPEEIKQDTAKIETEKTPPADDKSLKIEPDKPAEKAVLPEMKKTDTKTIKKTAGKKPAEKKKSAVKTDRKKAVVKDNSKIKTDKNKIEIVESKDKKEKKEEKKLPADNKKKAADKKIVKPSEEKKSEAVSADQKKKKTDSSKISSDKKDKKMPVEKITKDDVPVKKMSGIVRIENDGAGKVIVYASLKDSMDLQSIDLKGKYAVTKIDFRTSDDGYYAGSEPDRSGITEISFINDGRAIPFDGIDALKKSYIGRYNKRLAESISGKTFLMYENDDVSLRVSFRRDGVMEFHDRFKCAKKGGSDCTSSSMPDRWRITDGKLFMRFNNLWRNWRYELDSQSDMLSDSSESDPPRWMKLYRRAADGFTGEYLDLVKSENGVWAE